MNKEYYEKATLDLFFADEEEELTEFEKELEMMMVSFSNSNVGSDIRKEMPKQKLHNYAHRLLDLARKEIHKEEQEKLGTLEMPIDPLNPHYQKGREDALKSLDKREMASEDLEEAASKYVREDFHERSRADFKAGAEWQKQQMKEAIQNEYEKGRFDMQQEMMKDSVDAIFIQDYAYKTPVLYGDLKYKMNIVSGQPIKLYQIVKEN